MKLADKIYTALVIVMALLMLFVVIIFYFLMLHKAEDPQMFHFMIYFFLLLFLIFAVTAVLNLAKGRLLPIPTIVQAAFLLLTLYGIPIAIFGVILLYRRHKQSKLEQQPAPPPSAPAALPVETFE